MGGQFSMLIDNQDESKRLQYAAIGLSERGCLGSVLGVNPSIAQEKGTRGVKSHQFKRIFHIAGHIARFSSTQFPLGQKRHG